MTLFCRGAQYRYLCHGLPIGDQAIQGDATYELGFTGLSRTFNEYGLGDPTAFVVIESEYVGDYKLLPWFQYEPLAFELTSTEFHMGHKVNDPIHHILPELIPITEVPVSLACKTDVLSSYLSAGKYIVAVLVI
jgi:hypothetical protein